MSSKGSTTSRSTIRSRRSWQKQARCFLRSFDTPGEVHSASGNASATQPVKFLAIVFTKKGDPITIPG